MFGISNRKYGNCVKSSPIQRERASILKLSIKVTGSNHTNLPNKFITHTHTHTRSCQYLNNLFILKSFVHFFFILIFNFHIKIQKRKNQSAKKMPMNVTSMVQCSDPIEQTETWKLM